jgi:hypothetical protein
MKLILATSVILLCAGCAAPAASTKLSMDDEVRPLSRDEVIMAIRECETSHMRAVVSKVPVRVGNSRSTVVVDVTCSPRYDK